MKIHVKLDKSVDEPLRLMAEEARCTVEDIVEYAVYATIAGWHQEKGQLDKSGSILQATSRHGVATGT